MKKALITGANGFIGSLLVDELIKNGVDVIAADLKGHNDKVSSQAKFVDFDMHKCLMTAEPSKAAALEIQLRERYGDRADIYRSDPYFIEVMPQGVDKGAALGKLLAIIGAGWEDTVCCGDGYNDISMIRQAAVGVAMANAQPEVRAAADYVAPGNDEDGLVQVINRYILQEAVMRINGK